MTMLGVAKKIDIGAETSEDEDHFTSEEEAEEEEAELARLLYGDDGDDARCRAWMHRRA